MPRHIRFELGAARAGIAATLLFSTGCLHRHRHRQRAAPVAQTAAPAQTTPSAPGPRPIPGTVPPRTPGHASAAAEPAVPMLQGEEGFASWYGHPFHGRSTSSGEIYNMYDITAAHKTLPFGTQVRVHDLDNGETVDVRINDRGPFVEGRIIDLSYAAAQAVHLVGPGTALVRLEILTPELVAGPAAEPGVYAVQVGAFRDRNNAERLKQRIESVFGPVVIQSFDRGDGLFHRVRVGRAETEDAARDLATELQQAGMATETFIVRLN